MSSSSFASTTGQSPVPPFFHLIDPSISLSQSKPYYESTLRHAVLGCDAFTLWWPPTIKASPTPDVVLLFIPGNPGLLGFYTTFLSSLHSKAKAANKSIAILAKAHLGHTPGLPPPGPGRDTLSANVDSAIDALDILAAHYGPKTKYILVAHSLGTWVSIKVLKARPQLVSSAFLLFATISHLAKTPNGLRLGWVFHEPIPWLAAKASYLLRLLPRFVVESIFSHWPPEQIAVLVSMLQTPTAIRSALRMAHEEMLMIAEPDIQTLRKHEHKLHLYYGEVDNWVGDQKDVVLSCLTDPAAVKVVHGISGIPHDFCINHGEPLAEQCFQWLKELC